MVNHWLILIRGYSRGYWGYILIFWDLVCIISRNKCGQHTNYQAYFFELNNEAKSPIHSPLLSILQIWLKLNCIYQNQARILAGEILIFCDLPSGDQAWLAGKPFSCRWLSQRNLHLVRGFSHIFPVFFPKFHVVRGFPRTGWIQQIQAYFCCSSCSTSKGGMSQRPPAVTPHAMARP